LHNKCPTGASHHDSSQNNNGHTSERFGENTVHAGDQYSKHQRWWAPHVSRYRPLSCHHCMLCWNNYFSYVSPRMSVLERDVWEIYDSRCSVAVFVGSSEFCSTKTRCHSWNHARRMALPSGRDWLLIGRTSRHPCAYRRVIELMPPILLTTTFSLAGF